MLNRRFRGRAAFRLLFFLPYVLSEAVPASCSGCCCSPTRSSTTSLTGVGLGHLVQDWLGDSDIVMLTMFVIISWKYFGFHMILMLAGLQGIPRELKEAALIDGADKRQAFRYVTLPLLGPDDPRLGLPLDHRRAAAVRHDLGHDGRRPAQRLEHDGDLDVQGRASRAPRWATASALAVILFLFSLVVALAYQRFVLRRDTEGALTSFGG